MIDEDFDLSVDVALFLLYNSDSYDNISYVTPSKNYFYLGLKDFLEEMGSNYKKLNLNHIQKAWNLYKNRYKPFPRTKGVNYHYIERSDYYKTQNKKQRRRGKTVIMNMPSSSFIKLLVREGMYAKEIIKVLNHFGVDLKRTTVYALISQAKKNPKEQIPYSLTEDQINKLFALI